MQPARHLAAGLELALRALPLLDREFVVTSVEGDGAGQRQGFHVVGVKLQGACDQLLGLAVELAPLGHAQRVGIVGIALRILRPQVQHPLVGRQRLRVALEHAVRAPEHGPALGVVGLGLETIGQALGHRFDLRHADLLLSGLDRRSHARRQRQAFAIAKPGIAHSGEQQHESCQPEQQPSRGLGRSVSRRAARLQHRGQQFGLDPVPGLTRGRAGQAARADQFVELGQLRLEFFGARHRGASSSGVSGSNAEAAIRWRRRNTTSKLPSAPAISSAGPTHNNAVLALNGGR